MAAHTIDAKGKLVLPGFINGHTHVPMALFRDIHDDVTLNDCFTNHLIGLDASEQRRPRSGPSPHRPCVLCLTAIINRN